MIFSVPTDSVVSYLNLNSSAVNSNGDKYATIFQKLFEQKSESAVPCTAWLCVFSRDIPEKEG
jgi:hypothetical protein